MKTFEYWFDFGSPASYLAWTQLPAIEAATGAQAVPRPMLLGGVFQATGNQSPATIESKGRYTFADFDRFARRYGVPLTRNPHFPINTLLLMRGAVAAQRLGCFEAYVDAAYAGMWEQSLNMADPLVVAAALRAAGLPGDAILAATQDPDVKQQLLANTQDAFARGAFGSPTFFVGDEIFFGKDRLRQVEDEIGARHA